MILENLIEELEEIINKSWGVPLSGGKCLVDVNQIEGIIYELKNNLPLDIQKARSIVEKEQQIIEGARSASETIVEKAHQRAQDIIEDQEIVRLSKQKAREIIVLAKQKEKEIKKSAYEYVENIMNSVEDNLKKCLSNIKDIKNTVHAQQK